MKHPENQLIKPQLDTAKKIMYRALIDEVLYYLEQNQMTQSQFAKQLGVSKGYVSKILNGDGDPKLSSILDLAFAIDKEPHLVFSDAPIHKPYKLPISKPQYLRDSGIDANKPPFVEDILDFEEVIALPILEEVSQMKAKIDGMRPIPEHRNYQLMQKLRYAWNFNSNAIEGNQLTYGETLTLIRSGLTAKGKPLKDHLNIQGHEKAVDMLLKMIQANNPLRQHDIRQFHQVLLKENYQQSSLGRDGNYIFRDIIVGSYKRKPNHVRKANGDIHYFAEPLEVPARITDLLAWYDSVSDAADWPPLLVATIFHHEFVAIHPFDDGNGRMGRVLMNYTLMKHGYPPIVVPLKQRKDYYNSLQEADDGNFTKLVNYLGRHLMVSLKVQLEVARGDRIYPYRWEES